MSNFFLVLEGVCWEITPPRGYNTSYNQEGFSYKKVEKTPPIYPLADGLLHLGTKTELNGDSRSDHQYNYFVFFPKDGKGYEIPLATLIAALGSATEETAINTMLFTFLMRHEFVEIFLERYEGFFPRDLEMPEVTDPEVMAKRLEKIEVLIANKVESRIWRNPTGEEEGELCRKDFIRKAINIILPEYEKSFFRGNPFGMRLLLAMQPQLEVDRALLESIEYASGRITRYFHNMMSITRTGEGMPFKEEYHAKIFMFFIRDIIANIVRYYYVNLTTS